MLPVEHRLTRPADFSATVRHGARAGRRRVVVHVRHRSALTPPAAPASLLPPVGTSPGTPGAVVSTSVVRVGLVVGKSVGGAVARHAVSRRLRHVAAALLASLPDDADVVLRALPPAATATSAELSADVRSALVRLGCAAVVP